MNKDMDMEQSTTNLNKFKNTLKQAIKNSCEFLEHTFLNDELTIGYTDLIKIEPVDLPDDDHTFISFLQDTMYKPQSLVVPIKISLKNTKETAKIFIENIIPYGLLRSHYCTFYYINPKIITSLTEAITNESVFKISSNLVNRHPAILKSKSSLDVTLRELFSKLLNESEKPHLNNLNKWVKNYSGLDTRSQLIIYVDILKMDNSEWGMFGAHNSLMENIFNVRYDPPPYLRGFNNGLFEFDADSSNKPDYHKMFNNFTNKFSGIATLINKFVNEDSIKLLDVKNVTNVFTNKLTTRSILEKSFGIPSNLVKPSEYEKIERIKGVLLTETPSAIKLGAIVGLLFGDNRDRDRHRNYMGSGITSVVDYLQFYCRQTVDYIISNDQFYNALNNARPLELETLNYILIKVENNPYNHALANELLMHILLMCGIDNVALSSRNQQVVFATPPSRDGGDGRFSINDFTIIDMSGAENNPGVNSTPPTPPDAPEVSRDVQIREVPNQIPDIGHHRWRIPLSS